MSSFLGPHIGLFYRGVHIKASQSQSWALSCRPPYSSVPSRPQITNRHFGFACNPPSSFGCRGAPPPPKHTLLRTQLDYRYAVLSSTYYGTTMETILARVWWSQLALFFSWALAFRPGPSRLPFRASMQLSGSFCSYHSNKLLEALHALQAWPAWLLGHLRREREP